MTKRELIAKIEKMNEWEEMIAEAQAEVNLLKDSIKAEMAERETEELEAGSYIVRYKTVSTSRFDSTSFKKTYEDLYKAFLKQTTSRRFSISY